MTYSADTASSNIDNFLTLNIKHKVPNGVGYINSLSMPPQYQQKTKPLKGPIFTNRVQNDVVANNILYCSSNKWENNETRALGTWCNFVVSKNPLKSSMFYLQIPSFVNLIDRTSSWYKKYMPTMQKLRDSIEYHFKPISYNLNFPAATIDSAKILTFFVSSMR